MEASFIFQFIILIISVIIHEVAHGYMALWLGDPTAKYEGRLTLNPVKHIDLWGSIIIPIITTLAGFTFGWAKPVPYNPYNLRNQRWGDALVAIAGPASNIILASLFGLVIRLGMHFSFLSAEFISLASLVVLVNIVLALFNLVPIHPLDGGKILVGILPKKCTFFSIFRSFASTLRFSSKGPLPAISRCIFP